jgi:hypothetical protein
MYGKSPWTAGISSSDPVAPLRAKPDSVQLRSSYCREDTCTRSNLAGFPDPTGPMKKLDSSPGSIKRRQVTGISDSSPLSQPILTFGMRSRAMLSSYLPDLSTAQNQKRLIDTNHGFFQPWGYIRIHSKIYHRSLRACSAVECIHPKRLVDSGQQRTYFVWPRMHLEMAE